MDTTQFYGLGGVNRLKQAKLGNKSNLKKGLKTLEQFAFRPLNNNTDLVSSNVHLQPNLNQSSKEILLVENDKMIDSGFQGNPNDSDLVNDIRNERVNNF